MQVMRSLEGEDKLVPAMLRLTKALHELHALVDEESTRKHEGGFANVAFEAQKKHLANQQLLYIRQLDSWMDEEDVSCASLEAKMKEAGEVVGKEELTPLWERLEQRRTPFKINVATLSGSEVPIQVSRIDTVERVRSLVATELEVWPYRIQLSNEYGDVLDDAKTLEACGIYTSVPLFAVVLKRDKFREMSHQDFVELVVAKGFAAKRLLSYKRPDDDMVFRSKYIPRLQAEEDEHERQRQRKEEMQRQLEAVSVEASKLVEQLGETEAASRIMQKIADEEGACDRKRAEILAIRDDAQRDLDVALPTLNAARQALNRLDKKDICEVKCFARPPHSVALVGEAVCILFGEKPSWDNTKKLFCDHKLLQMMLQYDQDNIDPDTIARIQPYIDNEDFDPARVRMASLAAASFCMWVRAIHTYDRVAKLIEPKRRCLLAAEERLQDATSLLHSWQQCAARLQR